MGAKHSAGVVHHDIQDVLPRSWAELEQFYTRFQQEVHRRKSNDNQCQFFLPFAVFQSIIGRGARATWRDKEEILQAYGYLDSARKSRIPAVDFFAGLAMITKANKSIKFEFLFSLIDNGRSKYMNACEVSMVLAAAARGLAMLKGTKPVDDESLHPIARRLMGDSGEASRQSIVEKALTDTEIVFFMNDLENDSATSSDALLAQQARQLKSLASYEIHRKSEVPPKQVQLGSDAVKANGSKTMTSSHDLMMKRLQSALLPQDNSKLDPTRVRPNERKPALLSKTKRVDRRTLIRLVESVSDGSIVMAESEGERVLAALGGSSLGQVKCSELLRVMRGVLELHSEPSSLWEEYARRAREVFSRLRSKYSAWTAQRHFHGHNSSGDSATVVNDAQEINVTFNARFNRQEIRAVTPVQGGDSNKIRARLFTRKLHLEADTSMSSDAPSQASLIVVHFGLPAGLSEDKEAGLALAIAHFLSDEEIKTHVDFALESSDASIVDSPFVQDPLARSRRCLRLELRMQESFSLLLQGPASYHFDQPVKHLYAAIEFDQSMEDLWRDLTRVNRLTTELFKPDVRESVLAELFQAYDHDQDGLWSLQEFNEFQQAMENVALTDREFLQCFSSRREVTLADVVDCFAGCSVDEFRHIISKLGLGSLESQLSGTCTFKAAFDAEQLKAFESQLSKLDWGDENFKRVVFASRALIDSSWAVESTTFGHLLTLLGLRHQLQVLQNSSRILNLVSSLKAFLTPKHAEHERDFVCRSLVCSLESEATKTPQQLELEDQQKNLPRGSSFRRAATLNKALLAATLVRECIVCVERIELTTPHLNIDIEIDNLNFSLS